MREYNRDTISPNKGMAMRSSYLIALSALLLMGAAPSRTCTYTAGEIIEPDCVGGNEDGIFTYLQGGVDTYKSGTVDSTAITNGTITGTDISSETITTSNILDGTIVAADIATDGVGTAEIAADAVGTSEIATSGVATAEILDGTILNIDVGASAAIDFSKFATLASGNILVGSAGGVATSVAMSGDVAIIASGATTIQDNSVDGTDIAIGSDAIGDTLYYDGTNWVILTAGTSGYFLKANGAAAPTWAIPAGIPQNIQVFTSTGTWTKPANISTVYVKVWGGGEAGTNGSADNGGTGGGGGGYSEGLVTVTGNVTVTVGVGGATTGADGGLSSFAGATTPTANGGAAAAGGTASGGTINITGGASMAPSPSIDGEGGSSGGGSHLGGAGGTGCPGGNAANPGNNGAAGVVPGGGGGGGSEGGAFAAGADGMVIVYY